MNVDGGRTAMKLAEFEAMKAWHQRHWREQPVEKHVWDIVLTLWLVGWVGFPVGVPDPRALGRGGLRRAAVPARRLRRAAPRLHRGGVLRCDWSAAPSAGPAAGARRRAPRRYCSGRCCRPRRRA